MARRLDSTKGAGFTVTRLAREGKLPGFKVGGSWRFGKDEFEKWVEERTDGKDKRIRRYH